MRKKIKIIFIAVIIFSFLFAPLYDEEVKKEESVLGETTSLHISIKNILDHLDVEGITDPIQAGQLSNVTVTAIKLGGGVAPDYEGTVTFTSSDSHASVLLPTDYTFTMADAGTHTFVNTVRLITPGEQSVTATDINSININGSQNNITVLPGEVAKITLQANKTSLTANGTDQAVITATLEDAYGNKVANGTTVDFSITFGTGSLSASSATTSSGQVQVTYTTVTTSGSTTIEVSSGSIKANITITLTAGAVTHLEVSGIKSPITAGELSNVRIRALDQYNNVNTQYTGTIAFTSTATQVTLPANYTFAIADQGDHTFTSIVSFQKVGIYSVTATDINDSSITGAQNNIQVIADKATGTITASGHDVYINNLVAITSSKVVDAYDNVVAGLKVTFHVTKPDGQTINLEAETNSEGVASASLTAEQTNLAGTYTVTASAEGLITGAATAFRVLTAEEEIVIPVSVITYPAYEDQEIATNTPTIKGTSIANGNVTVYIYGPDGSLVLTLTAEAGENGQWEVSVPSDKALDKGRYGVQAKAANDQGHESVLSALIHFKVTKERVAPTKPEEKKEVPAEKKEAPKEEKKPEEKKPEEKKEIPEEKEVPKEIEKEKEVKKITRIVVVPFAGLSAGVILLSLLLAQLDLLDLPFLFIRLWLLLLYLLGLRKRARPWGIVYHAVTKLPVDLALVQLFDKASDKIIESQVTDSFGKFGFKVKPGEYYIKVKKTGYNFPSKIVRTEADFTYFNVYLGNLIKVKDPEREAIIINIPIDPVKIEVTKAKLLLIKILDQVKSVLVVIHFPILIIGILLSVFSFVIIPNFLNSLILGVYVVILIIEYLFQRHHGKTIWHSA